MIVGDVQGCWVSVYLRSSLQGTCAHHFYPASAEGPGRAKPLLSDLE